MYLRIVGALAEDIAAGRLHRGQMLPTHRMLAHALGVDLTTVTRAYAEAHRQGLTEATVGRGTFVKGRPIGARTTASPGIDLSMNLPPQPQQADLDVRLAKALSDVRADAGLAAYLTYQQPGGTPTERQAAAAWLNEQLALDVAPQRLLVTPGTQSALFALLLALAAPGSTVLTERITYPGFKSAAAAVGVRLIGVEMDDEGIVPAALDKAARAGDANIVFLMPTMHNPTTATMSAERRKRVATVVRRRGLTLIEDDPYTFLAPGLPPVSSLIPERTYLAASLSKCIAPGLRMSLVVAPDQTAAERLCGLLRATLQMPAPLMTAIAVRWMRDGTANAIVDAIRTEAAARQTIAHAALAKHAYAAHPAGHHVWLPLPGRWPAARFAAQLQGRGLAVVTSDAFATDQPPPNAIRLALGAAHSRTELAKALEILAEVLDQSAPNEIVV
ncbi:PLP-dependent aminotransferase family protein [Hyphomicrobium sp. CS1GBMeth3]|uniref:aminotransferase-like domain-containing protein n=1 Tax=Hyphomicrobium sp. CS1GBMeth3 TaxID=1892845 RepID=UPI000AAE5804|nr:PLP-dependent aminotransferase family protein [Hyphomicrobium sp. CS1GBMeth3]